MRISLSLCSLLWIASVASSNAESASTIDANESNVENSHSSTTIRGADHDKKRSLLLFDIFKIFPTYPSTPWFPYPSPPVYPSPPLFNPVPPPPSPVQSLVCATLQTDRYFNLIVKHSNMALNVENSSTNNGASLIQWPVNSANNDNWRFESVGNGYYQIIAQHSQKGVNGTLYLEDTIIFIMQDRPLIVFFQ